MSSDRRIRSSRANGALSRGPKTEAGKNRSRLNGVKHGIFAKTTILNNESPLFFTKLRDEYYHYLQPANPIERDLVDEMVISKWFCRRAWRLENSTVNYKMDEQAAELAARHTRLMEHSRTSIAYQTLYDNGHALRHIQRAQARNSRMYHRALDKLEALRRDPPQENEQPNPVPNPDTTQPMQETHIVTPPPTLSNQIRLSRRRRRLIQRKLTLKAPPRTHESNPHNSLGDNRMMSENSGFSIAALSFLSRVPRSTFGCQKAGQHPDPATCRRRNRPCRESFDTAARGLSFR